MFLFLSWLFLMTAGILRLASVADAVEYELVVPLCREIETDLRLMIHVHVAQLPISSQKNPVSLNPLIGR